MMKNIRSIKLKLHTKIALLIILVVLISIVNTGFLIAERKISNLRQETERNIMNLAQIIANTSVVKENLDKNDIQGIIQSFVETILNSTKGIDIIVVVNMNDIRYAHPVRERIGEKFVGGDEKRVLTTGESYISVATGTLGEQIRAFVPVYNNNTQVGFVMVSQKIESFRKTIYQSIYTVLFSTFIGLLIGIMGAFILAKRIKNTLLGLEPEEISKLYLQKEAMLDAMHEGIIAVDTKYDITLFNNSAIKMLELKEQDLIGKNIQDVLPGFKLDEVIKTGIAEYFREQVINDTVLVVNMVPLKEGKKITGVIATFNDKTMVTRLAEEITGVNQVVDALRANTHEFMNRLHVILGLIQIGELDEARKFILNETDKQQKIISLVLDKIKDPAIAGLVLGKISRAKELGIHMEIDNDSSLSRLIGRINSNVLITIIGNLLENAMDALNSCENEPKLIKILINESNYDIKIIVYDTGCGIRQDDISKIFDKGFTTKDNVNRGRGLHLVKELVDNLCGSINVESKTGRYTKFEVLMPKGGALHD